MEECESFTWEVEVGLLPEWGERRQLARWGRNSLLTQQEATFRRGEATSSLVDPGGRDF